MSDYTEHAKLSPSGSAGWFACPGKPTMEAPIPNVPSKASDDGTGCHFVAAQCLTADVAAGDFVGDLIPVNGRNEPERAMRFTDEHAEIVQGYVDTIRAIAGEHKIYVEQRVEFSDFCGVPDQFGTLDCGIHFVDQGEIFIGDLKSGWTPVEPQDNSQLMIYALGFLRMLWQDDLSTTALSTLQWGYEQGIKTIRLAIYQPKHHGLQEWTCDLDYLGRFSDILRSKAQLTVGAEKAASLIPQAEWELIYLNPKPNEVECAFCRALPTCPAAQRAVQEAVGADFESITDAIPIPKGRASLAAAMAAAPFVEDFMQAVRAETERQLLAGQTVAGFGLELGRKGARKFSDEAAVELLLRKTWRLPIVDIFDMKLKSPTSLEQMTKPTKADPLSGMPAAPPILGGKRWKRLAEFITQAPPKPSVKPIKLIKVPYSPTPVADDFSTVKE